MARILRAAIAECLRWLADKLDPPECRGSFGGTDPED